VLRTISGLNSLSSSKPYILEKVSSKTSLEKVGS
jgi:hypothetical protein